MTQINATLPPIYGYMRIERHQSEDTLHSLEAGLRLYAEAQGYQLVRIFQEFVPGCHRTFAALVDQLKRTDAHHVVVPSMEHLARHPLLQIHMVIRLELEAHAEVFEVGDA